MNVHNQAFRRLQSSDSLPELLHFRPRCFTYPLIPQHERWHKNQSGPGVRGHLYEDKFAYEPYCLDVFDGLLPAITVNSKFFLSDCELLACNLENVV